VAGVELPLGTNLLTFTATDTNGFSSTYVYLLLVRLPVSANTNISISEFMAKNLTSIVDEDGVHSDWIELRNAGGCPMNMAGWYLTDDPKKLTKWRFPGTNIDAGGYLVVWASDKNRRVPGAPLHTNFKMADEGEYLALVQPDGVTIATQFAPTFPPQLPDVTYGLPVTGGTNNYLAWPTPGARNSPATNSAIAEVVFKPTRGWYTNVVDISLHTATENLVSGLKIYYTTNGSMPSPTNGYVYSQHVVLGRTTVLRAAAYVPGMLPSATESHTYIFPTQVPQQTGAGFPTNWGTFAAIYRMHPTIVNDPQWGGLIPGALLSVPTVSLSMDLEDIFGTNGIYANPFGDGSAWERACSVEYIRNDTRPGFHIDCGVQLQGDLSRDPLETPKHNFRLYFRQSYGFSKLSYALYHGSPVSEFNTLVLHASFNDHWYQLGAKAQMLRDQWVADTQRETGGHGTHGNFVNLYVNGLYWGLYNLGERPDAAYAASYLGGLRSDYDGFNADELKDGGTNARNEMLTMVKAGITNAESYANLEHYLDIPDFADYMLINMYAANIDWPIHNFWLVGSVSNGVPFHFLSWDAEVSFIGINWNLTGIDTGTPGLIYHALCQYPEFRRLLGDRAHRLLFDRGALTPERSATRWMQRAQEINSAIVAESARWGVTWRVNTRNDWLQEQNLLMTEWFPNRTAILIDQLRAAGLYPLLDAPDIAPHGGFIDYSEPAVVNLTVPIGTIYYTTNGTDPRLPDGGLSPEAQIYNQALVFTDSTQLRARTFHTNTWSALAEADFVRTGQVPVRISDYKRRIDGTIELDFQGFPGTSYTLYTSTNLVDWEPLTTMSPDADGAFRYLDQAAANAKLRFYKLSSP